jgi:adenosine kinase
VPYRFRWYRRPGSIAYDTIMVFRDRFKNHILPDKVHILNVSFLVPRHAPRVRRLRRQYRLQPEAARRRAAPMATVGEDYGPYRERLEGSGITTAHVHTARSGLVHRAGLHHHRPRRQPDHRVSSGRDECARTRTTCHDARGRARHRRPRRREGMLQHARSSRSGHSRSFSIRARGCRCSRRGAPAFVEQATYVTVNDYESKPAAGAHRKNLECGRYRARGRRPRRHPRPEGLDDAHRAVADRDPGGEAGARGRSHGLRRRLPRRPALRLAHGWDWETTGRLASLLGAIKIAQRGGQNHQPAREDIVKRFQQAFGYSPWKGQA